MNNDNLIPMNKRTKEEQREIASKGGKASGKARRKKRTMKEAARLILYAPVSAEEAEMLKRYGVADNDCTNLMLIIAKAIQKAADGDIKAISFIRDIIGENPNHTTDEKKTDRSVSDGNTTKQPVNDWVAALIETEEQVKG